MAQSIGTFTFTAWKGFLAPAQQEVAVFAQPGVDGFGVQFGAYRAPPQTIITTVTVADMNTANALVYQYRKTHRQYQPVTVVDQFGFTYPNTLILAVGPGEPPLWVQQTNFGVRIVTRWELLIESVRP